VSRLAAVHYRQEGENLQYCGAVNGAKFNSLLKGPRLVRRLGARHTRSQLSLDLIGKDN
jgi:hypothetical protein